MKSRRTGGLENELEACKKRLGILRGICDGDKCMLKSRSFLVG